MDTAWIATAGALVGAVVGAVISSIGGRQAVRIAGLLEARVEAYGAFVEVVHTYRRRRMDRWHLAAHGKSGADDAHRMYDAKTAALSALGRVRILTSSQDVAATAQDVYDTVDMWHSAVPEKELDTLREQYFQALTRFLDASAAELQRRKRQPLPAVGIRRLGRPSQLSNAPAPPSVTS